MVIRVLRKMRYQNTLIYIMQFEYVFQYLFAWDDRDIFQNNIVFLPPWWKRVLWRMGFIEYPYSKEQLEDGEKVILSGAMATIDEISSPEFRAKRREAQKAAKVTRAKSPRKDCVWQAYEAKDGVYYMCLIHGKAVKMKDGEKPSHG